MRLRYFLQSLALTSAITAITLLSLHKLLPQTAVHQSLSIGSILIFTLVSFALYTAGTTTAKSQNKYAFTNLISLSVFGKLLVSVATLLIYQKTNNPSDNWFVAIFLWCYVIYTSFEVWFMTKIANQK
jgi:hypothetical protein